MEIPDALLRSQLLTFLENDVGMGDITTEAIVPKGTNVHAEIVVKEKAVVAGLHETCLLLEVMGVKARYLVNDGTEVQKGTTIVAIDGEAKDLLFVERTLLNILMRMSGIATATRRLVRKIEKAGLSVRVAATRKTAPGLRYFDKRAVVLGGGDPHRFRLDDSVLIKDNHIAIAGGIRESLKRVLSVSFAKKIEVETKNLEEAVEAANCGADIIMLDNMPANETAHVIGELKRLGLRERVLIEISGRIDEKNLLDYAAAEPNILSLGSLTHSVKAIDMSLEVKRVNK